MNLTASYCLSCLVLQRQSGELNKQPYRISYQQLYPYVEFNPIKLAGSETERVWGSGDEQNKVQEDPQIDDCLMQNNRLNLML